MKENQSQTSTRQDSGGYRSSGLTQKIPSEGKKNRDAKAHQVMKFERADLSINSEDDPEWSDNENIHAQIVH